MSNSRTDYLSRYTRIFKALSNPYRLSIFLRLVRCCDPGAICREEADTCVCVGDLGRDLGIVPSTVCHHIKELRHAGLIVMERQGQTIQCSVAAEALHERSNIPRRDKTTNLFMAILWIIIYMKITYSPDFASL